jgi:site-specific DNA recombinase
MFLESICQLAVLGSLSVLIVVPAVVFNRRADRSIQSLTRAEVLCRTLQEIDEVFAWYEGVYTRDRSTCVGCCYARYSTPKQDSIGAQIRKILEHAIRLGIYVSREFIFFDTAVSGRKGHREGLAKLEATLQNKKCQALIVFGTNRLFRKSWRTLQFADRVHQCWGIRIIFVAQGIDTNDKKWEVPLAVHALIDQFVVTIYADNIRAAQEGLFERRLVFGSISHGYDGQVIEGEFSRTGKPRRRLVINEVTARVVRLIFDLYVHQRLGLHEIARVLNDDPSSPLPQRCTSGLWTNDSVRRILTNTRYRGYWQYGITEAVYNSEADYVGKITRSEPLKAAQIEELRIVDDDLWFAAAQLVAQNGHGFSGRKLHDGDLASRPKTLNGLLYCEVHQRPLVVVGAFGSHMACPECMCLPRRKRPLTSWLNRAVALGQFIEEISRRILADDDFVAQVIEACRHAAEEQLRPNPSSERQAKVNLEKLRRSIEFTLKNPGETDDDRANSLGVLRQLRMEKAKREAELSRLNKLRTAKRRIPTLNEVRAVLKELATLLTTAAQSDDPADRACVRVLVEELTGGRIIVSQQGERKKQHGWLRGTFQLRLLSTVLNRISDGAIAYDDDGTEISIDFKRPLSIDAKAEIAWQMNHDKKRHEEIGALLKCGGSYVTRLLKYHAKKNGLTWVDGRSLRLEFPHLNRKPALFKRLVEKVMSLFKKDVPLGEIAEECDVHVATVRKSIKWYHEQNKLVVPNGRTRAGRIKRNRNRGANP